MTSKFASFQGRLSTLGRRASTMQSCAWLGLLFGLLFVCSAWAENILQDISYTPLSGITMSQAYSSR